MSPLTSTSFFSALLILSRAIFLCFVCGGGSHPYGVRSYFVSVAFVRNANFVSVKPVVTAVVLLSDKQGDFFMFCMGGSHPYGVRSYFVSVAFVRNANFVSVKLPITFALLPFAGAGKLTATTACRQKQFTGLFLLRQAPLTSASFFSALLILSRAIFFMFCMWGDLTPAGFGLTS